MNTNTSQLTTLAILALAAVGLALPATPDATTTPDEQLGHLDCPIADLNVAKECEDYGFYCEDDGSVQAVEAGFEESPCFEWCKCVRL
ncbi:hypothetical protein QC762_108895 [Podospora pseudocomata]|uniref:Uncharacterized protein n=2 Tax=Podospora TaxID=5144 RepID=A0ABR0GU60_9PEZI|nr:hypothetical protein QC761_108895 [Podospora bellae-mahoneyi]KAK4659293.1 hypothetical protein QC762_108895 [Podospora pseudocomata]